MIFKHKKSLGQNFLKAPHVLEKMCHVAEISKTDTVLEIGPGKGVLTEKLLEKAGRVISIEKDNRLIKELQQKFSTEISAEKLILLNEDALLFNPREYGLKEGEYKIVANIPYYITGAILEYFIGHEIYPKSMTLMVQKEVAKRIVANDEKESLLSVSVKAYGTPKYVETVKKELFKPKPKVDSAILHISDISKEKFLGARISEAKFFEIVKRGFAHKRKRLAKNLKISGEDLEKVGLKNGSRAENLSIENWFSLSSLY